MTSIRIRPRFKETYNLTPKEVEDLVRHHLKEPDCPCAATVIPGFIVLRILAKQQHFWSPQLSLSFEKEEDGERTIVRGLYGPNPTIWTGFVFIYSVLGVAALFISMAGITHLQLGMGCKLLWLLPVLALAALALYLIAQTGQKLGVEQTFTLHHFFEESIGKRIHIK